MAEDVASRVADAEALPPELRERLERAAARFGSIHERWSTSEPAEAAAPRSKQSAAAGIEEAAPSSDDDRSAMARDAVSVTPILGIDTDESDESGRPRFKTLMGVPRSSPDLDELAGLDSSSARDDTVPVERSALPPRAPAPAGIAERANPRVDEAPSLTGTSLPWEPGAPPASSPRLSPAPWPALGRSSLEVSAEVATLRTASRRRPWWVGLGTIAAAAVVFAIAAPRQRTQALRWLESVYGAPRQTASVAISDTARALRPGSSAATALASASDSRSGQLELPGTLPQRAMAEPSAAGAGEEEQAVTVPSPAVGSNQGPVRDVQALATAVHEAAESAELASPPAGSRAEIGAPKNKQAARDARSGGTTTKARTRVAAPRKASRGADNRQSASAAKVAAGATKARATHQNTPRKDGGSGIIRETPF